MKTNKHDFIIPQVEEERIINEEDNSSNKKVKGEQFVSPIYGKHVKDNVYFPSVSYQNGAKQYDSFRDEDKKIRKEDYVDYIIRTDNNYKQNNTEEVNNNYNKQNNNNQNYNVPNNQSNEYASSANRSAQTIDHRYDDIQTEKAVFEKDVETEAPTEYKNFSPYATSKTKEAEVNEAPSAPKRVNLQYNESPKPVQRKEKKKPYLFPPLSILRKKTSEQTDDYSGVQKQRDIIDRTLKEFDVSGHVVKYTKGPTVTLFEIQLDPGVKYNKVPQLQYNFQGNLEAVSIRIEAPIPGKATVGIEVPNISRDIVFFGDLANNEKFLKDGNPLNVILGLDIAGVPVYLDIKKMPHGLIAGCTGSGKSVCINSIIVSILYKAHPDDVKLILIDPKKVEFSKFVGIPHLATPIITDNKLAAASLKWAVDEMESRYELFASKGASNYKEYLELNGDTNETKHMPYVVIIIDELADLMVSGADVEESIMRLTAKARAAGIHLLVCTQRPSVNVINGTIKTNIPARIAFKVNKSIDSNIILDRMGAEKLLGQGDMLYDEEDGRQRRIQGSYISGTEIKDVVQYIEDNYDSEFLFDVDELNKRAVVGTSEDDPANDEMFLDVARYVVDTQNASINNLQKKFGCGFNRIQSIIQKLEELNIVSENLGSRARTVLVSPDELEDIINNL